MPVLAVDVGIGQGVAVWGAPPCPGRVWTKGCTAALCFPTWKRTFVRVLWFEQNGKRLFKIKCKQTDGFHLEVRNCVVLPPKG